MLRLFNAHLNELEARAEKDTHFVDYQHLAATKEYSAVMCTVSSKAGKRVCRMAGNSDITVAQEEAGYMALCAFYGEAMKVDSEAQTTAKTQQRAVTQPSAPAQQKPAAGQTAQTKPTGSAPVTPTGRPQPRQTAAGQSTPTGNRPANQSRPANTNQPIQRPAAAPQRPVGATQANPVQTANTAPVNTRPSQPGQENAATTGRTPDDFQVMIGNFKHSENNWISSLVQNPETLQVLRNISDIANPVTESMKEPIQQVRQYLAKHRLL